MSIEGLLDSPDKQRDDISNTNYKVSEQNLYLRTFPIGKHYSGHILKFNNSVNQNVQL